MTEEGSRLVAAVMIGIDPHKGSHTAVAIDAAEGQLGTLQVRASASQASRLVEWAAAWPDLAGSAPQNLALTSPRLGAGRGER